MAMFLQIGVYILYFLPLNQNKVWKLLETNSEFEKTCARRDKSIITLKTKRKISIANSYSYLVSAINCYFTITKKLTICLKCICFWLRKVDIFRRKYFNLPNHSHHNMTICGLSLLHGNTERLRNPQQKFIFQLGTLSPHGINKRLSFH